MQEHRAHQRLHHLAQARVVIGRDVGPAAQRAGGRRLAVTFQDGAYLVIHARDLVVQAGLVLEHGQRHDIALAAGITAGVEIGAEVLDVVAAVAQLAQLLAATTLAQREVAQVRALAHAAGHIPAAPAHVERGGIIHVGAGSDAALVRRMVHGRREHHHARHAATTHRIGIVAGEAATALAGELRRILAPVLDAVENRTLVRIHRGQLDQRAVLHEPDVGIVVEVHRPRRLWRDMFNLQAGAREHQHLRIHIDLQLLQHGQQVAKARLPLQLQLAAVQALLQPVHPVLGGRFGIRNPRIFHVITGGGGQLVRICVRSPRYEGQTGGSGQFFE